MAESSGARLLVIDDDVKLGRLLKDYLEPLGYSVDLAHNGSDGLREAAKVRYAAIILDVMMPGMSGFEVLKELRKRSSVPVLMFTGLGHESNRIEGLDVGADDYLPKTISTTELAARIRAVLRRSMTRQDQEELKEGRQALDEAATIQRALLPKELPVIAGYDISGVWLPARTISGDYYDVFRLTETHFDFCIADVAGKGMPAALLMANLQAAVGALSKEAMSPAEICRKVNNLLSGHVADGRFITFFYGAIDAANHRLSYSSAGHHPPLLIRKNGAVVNLEKGGLILGLYPNVDYDSEDLDLYPGDRILVFTDGITEAAAADGEQFGTERLLDIARSNPELGARALQDAIIGAVSEFSAGNFQDDVTMLTICVL